MKIGQFTKQGMNVFVYRGLETPGDHFLGKNEYSDAWGMHTKSYIIDDKIGFISSYNFDPRSKKFNAEMSVGCAHAGTFVDALKENIANRMDYSYQLTKDGELPENVPEEERKRLRKGAKNFILNITARWLDTLL